MSELSSRPCLGLPVAEPAIAFAILEAVFDAFVRIDLDQVCDPDLYERFRTLAGEIFASQVADTQARMARQMAMMEEQAAALSLHFDMPEIVNFCRRAADIFRHGRAMLTADSDN
jgi:hypothetical protein